MNRGIEDIMENANNTSKNETFADLLADSFAENSKIEGTVVKGKVISIENDVALIDVGLKSEGRISLKEFNSNSAENQIKTGDLVDVFIEKIEGKNGETVLSREKAKREEAWSLLEVAHDKQEKVTGIIFGKVKGGFTVDLEGATAFLPGSQVDIRPIKDELNISEEDIAKRLIDYGFHAPTMSFPVPGTLMIEPTESESKEEIDRFVTAMISIHKEIEKVRNGKYDQDDNPIKNAPHTIEEISSDNWTHAYSRTEAAFPHSYLYNNKYWAPVARIDNVYGDRNLFCVCPPVEEYEEVSNA